MAELISQYPIVSAAMNKVSDSNLAIAVYRSGCIPSLSLFNHRYNGVVNYTELSQEIDKFISKTESTQVILSIGNSHLADEGLKTLLGRFPISHLEIIAEDLRLKGTTFGETEIEIFKKIENQTQVFRDKGTGLVFKSLTRFAILELEKLFPNMFEYYMLKGEDAAGSVVNRLDGKSLLDELKEIKQKYPQAKIIVAGGVSAGSDAKMYIDSGASLVALGTAFAMCKESCISLEAKNKILESKKVEKFKSSNQNAVMFDEYKNKDDFNHTGSLVSGIRGNAAGHVFIGKGINSITSIVTVNEMIKEFTNGIFA